MNDAGTQLSGEIRLGDCLDLIEKQDNIYDAIVTDPPYETSYQGKVWDSTYISFSPVLWARLFQVLKPGGFLAAFAAGRLYHRMATAAERAGFIIYPFMNWKFDGGLPKPINVSELFDRRKIILSDNQAEAFDVALKRPYRWVLISLNTANGMIARDWIRMADDCPTVTAKGRLVYDAHIARLNAPERPIIGYRVGSGYTRANVEQGLQNRNRVTFPIYARHVSQEAQEWRGHYYGVNAMKPCTQPIMMAQKPPEGLMLDNIRKYRTGALNLGALEQRLGSWPTTILEHPRARRSEHQSDHVSVKPVPLMEDLCVLLCPSGGMILDPFAGTGTTGVAARNQGFSFVLIEQNEDMQAVIQRRLLSQNEDD